MPGFEAGSISSLLSFNTEGLPSFRAPPFLRRARLAAVRTDAFAWALRHNDELAFNHLAAVRQSVYPGAVAFVSEMLSEAFSHITGKQCSVCMKLLVDPGDIRYYAQTLCRNHKSTERETRSRLSSSIRR